MPDTHVHRDACLAFGISRLYLLYDTLVEALNMNCLITTDTIRNAHELVRRRGVGAVGEVKSLSSTPPNTSKSDAMPVSCRRPGSHVGRRPGPGRARP